MSYSQHRWTSIEASLLRQSINLQEKLRKPRDHLLSTLALVRTGLEIGSRRWRLASDAQAQDDQVVAARLLENVKRLSTTLTRDFAVIDFPTFVITLTNAQGRFTEHEDGVVVDVLVENYLPCVSHPIPRLAGTSGRAHAINGRNLR